ncbi:conserved hypothetical protein [Pirellula staleyi DSM 6068]|uniref:Membrane associated protein n=1 Tax=Pirellula staleyi (strain ATCC 27377 / DSM 6068 / ICPB 4128) TaxID=530564 RepID=D2QXP6_PIRSD|nr:hypothetical protein [Pirellula staleyi]ADB16231.1 conserved hypothetical protein [Pirellula staleyi DSM 6068]
MAFQSLDPVKIIETADTLTKRVEERFPKSGLAQVSNQLLAISQQAQARSEWIARPLIWLRILTVVIVSVVVGGLLAAIITAEIPKDRFEIDDLLQITEAGINDVVLIGAAIFFLITMERRIKRGRALAAIHELRAIAHIIDMHQLTKDPERILRPRETTEHSPKQNLSLFLLRRYLDYCSEMLSLTGKIAALYVQRFDDDVSLDAASEVEDLSTGLSQKIWQKIMILHSFENTSIPSGGMTATVSSTGVTPPTSSA